MSVETTETTKTTTSMLGRIGLGATVLAGVVTAVPLLYTAYAFTGNVKLATTDDISGLFTGGVIITGLAALISLVSVGIHVPGVLAAPRRGLVTGGISAALLIVTALFLLVGILPRASAITHLKNNVVPFAETMRDSCQTPLNQVTTDLTRARDDSQATVKDDGGFTVAMQKDAQALTADVSALSTAQTNLKAAVVPDAKYQSLKDDCVAAVTGDIGFLQDDKDPNAIKLPAPYNAIQPTISVINLIKAGAAIAAGAGPITLPSGQIEVAVHFVLDQTVTAMANSPTGQKLHAEGDALTKDIKDTLSGNLAPFQSTVPVQ